MDPHVKRLADVLLEAYRENTAGGEMYESVTYDDDGNAVEVCPALKLDLEGRTANIILFDVPGSKDHFSIILNGRPRFTLSLREETRWDFVLKSFKRVEDHVIGNHDFDKKYLVGGQPQQAVIAFLQRPDVRSVIESMEPFLHLGCDVGFIRATFGLTPTSKYELKDLRYRINNLLRFAAHAEESLAGTVLHGDAGRHPEDD